MLVMLAGLNWYINDPPLSLSCCVSKDPKFTTCKNVFFGLVKPKFALGIPSLSPNSWSHCFLSPLYCTITGKMPKKIKYKPDRPIRQIQTYQRGLSIKICFDMQLHLEWRLKGLPANPLLAVRIY